MAWQGGFNGNGYTRSEFRTWLRSRPKPPYVRIVIHNTDAPYMVPPYGPTKRVAALKNYYMNDLRWSGGPDFFNFGGTDKVWLGSPMGKSVGSSGWNGNSFHIEAEGKYNTPAQDPTVPGSVAEDVWNRQAWIAAELCDYMGWTPDNERIKFHKEGKTTHDCPGRLVVKGWFIDKVKQALGIKPAPVQPKLAPAPAPTEYVWVAGVPSGDRLNFRAAPRTGKVTGTLLNGTKLELLGSQSGWYKIKTPAGYIGWISAQYASKSPPKPANAPTAPQKPVQPPLPLPGVPTPPAPVPVTPPPPPPAEPGVYAPGTARWSEDWLLPMMKEVEGLRLEAYYDKPGWAIGYGHNSTSKIPPIPYEGMRLRNEKEADAILRADLDDKLRYINVWVKVPLTQAQVDACVMDIFQQGPTQWRQRVIPLLNAGDYEGVAKLMESGGHEKEGVNRRRRFQAQRFRGSNSTKW